MAMPDHLNFARIRIIGPNAGGGFGVEFRKHTGERLCFVVPPNADNDVLSYFHARIPYGLVVPDLNDACFPNSAMSFRHLRGSHR
jgi:hypothetical protein